MDRVARLDDATIALLLPEVGVDDAALACERILVEARRDAPDIKGGVAHWPEDGYDMDTLLAAARTALEQAPPFLAMEDRWEMERKLRMVETIVDTAAE